MIEVGNNFINILILQFMMQSEMSQPHMSQFQNQSTCQSIIIANLSQTMSLEPTTSKRFAALYEQAFAELGYPDYSDFADIIFRHVSQWRPKDHLRFVKLEEKIDQKFDDFTATIKDMIATTVKDLITNTVQDMIATTVQGTFRSQMTNMNRRKRQKTEKSSIVQEEQQTGMKSEQQSSERDSIENIDGSKKGMKRINQEPQPKEDRSKRSDGRKNRFKIAQQ